MGKALTLNFIRMKNECEYCDDRECEDLMVGRLMTVDPNSDVPYLTIRPLRVATCIKVTQALENAQQWIQKVQRNND